MRDVVLDPPWLELHYDGKRKNFQALQHVKDEYLNHYKDAMDHIIEFPYNLEPGKKLLITMDDSNRVRDDLFLNRETGEYNYPETEGYLIAHFEDQLENSFVSLPFNII
jgi:hypothetical protein